jgi:hypothetical protein
MIGGSEQLPLLYEFLFAGLSYHVLPGLKMDRAGVF